MASVLKPIFEQVYKVKLAKIEQSLADAYIGKDQKKLAKEFYKLITLQRVVYFGENEKLRFMSVDSKYTWLKNTIYAYFKLGLSTQKIDGSIMFKFHEGRLWAVDSETQKPLAVTVESFVEKKTFLEIFKHLFSFNSKSKMQCLRLFGN